VATAKDPTPVAPVVDTVVSTSVTPPPPPPWMLMSMVLVPES